MGKNDSTDGCLAIFGAITLVFICAIFLPLISFIFAYFGGIICKVTFGPTLCYALNTLFGTTRFTPDMLPWMAGALGWIGGYFKSITTSSK